MSVGFEFEMNWMLQAPGNTIGMDVHVVQGTGWHVEPDMRPPTQQLIQQKIQGYGNLEFITDPFPETGPGLLALRAAMREITQFAAAIYRSYRGLTGWGLVPLHEFVAAPIVWGPVTGGLPARNEINIDRAGSEGSATPQMTAGIRREQVSDVLMAMSQQPQVGTPHFFDRFDFPNNIATILAQVDARAQTQAALRAGGMTAPKNRRYQSAISHLGGIVARGAHFTGDQLKYIHPLLSRTNFGDLPQGIRQHSNFREDVVVSSGIVGAAPWGTATGLQLTPNSNACHMTIGQWLQGISNGNDPLNWGQKVPATWAPAVVGPAGNQSTGHIYEFRGLRGDLPVSEWASFAERLFLYVQEGINTA